MTESAREVSLLEAHRHEQLHTIAAPAGAGAKKSRSSASVETLKDITFGSTAGMVGKVIEYPFDTIKVRLQSSTRFAGPLDCFVHSFRAEGLAGLYRGISAPMFGAAVETSSLFFSYRLAQDALRKTVYRADSENSGPLPLSVLCACGAASGAFTSLLLTPIELVKCQLQVPTDSHAARVAPATAGAGAGAGVMSLQTDTTSGRPVVQRNPLTVIAAVYRHGGLAGFWHGQLGTLIRETGGSAAWFGSYEGASAAFRKYWHLQDPDMTTGAPGLSQGSRPASLPMWQQMVAGACAGVSYNFLFYPADTIKSRMQTEEVGGSSGRGSTNGQIRPGFWKVGEMIWREQGLKGMYRGCGITVARAAPSSAFIFTVNETLRSWFA